MGNLCAPRRLAAGGRALCARLVASHALPYAMGLSVASGALAGIAPALLASRADLVEGLKAGGRGMSASRGRQRIRGTLVVTEMVLAVVLLVGAGLMVNGVQRLAEPGPNIHPEKVLTLWMNLPETRYPKPQQQARFQDDVLHRFASLPGVRSAALASALPYASPPSEVIFAIEGRAVPPAGTEPSGERAAVSAAYFENLRIQLQKGRLFDDRDRDGAPSVAIVSQHLARRYFAGEDPVGRRVRLGPADAKNPWCTIVGVVADIRRNPWDHEIDPVIYQPFRQAPGQRAYFVLRTAGDPLALVGAARAEVARVDPDQPVQDIRTYRKTMDHALVGLVYVASMMAVFGVIALLLSAAGVYGVMACSVAERAREIGLRMALGAQDRDVVWMVGRWGVLLTAGGLALGIPAAFGLAGLLKNLVYGVGAHDLLVRRRNLRAVRRGHAGLLPARAPRSVGGPHRDAAD